MTLDTSLLLLLLLSLCWALPLQEERREEEEDTVDITTRILPNNNATNGILLEGDLPAPRTRNAMTCSQHEINHALGFQHERTRSDHVRIKWENINTPMAYNFYRENTNNLNTMEEQPSPSMGRTPTTPPCPTPAFTLV